MSVFDGIMVDIFPSGISKKHIESSKPNKPTNKTNQASQTINQPAVQINVQKKAKQGMQPCKTQAT